MERLVEVLRLLEVNTQVNQDKLLEMLFTPILEKMHDDIIDEQIETLMEISNSDKWLMSTDRLTPVQMSNLLNALRANKKRQGGE